MARPSGQYPQSITDKSVLVMDCRASQTITRSLLNCSDVRELQTRIVTADGKESMTSTHACLKTDFLKQNRRSSDNGRPIPLRERITSRSSWRKVC